MITYRFSWNLFHLSLGLFRDNFKKAICIIDDSRDQDKERWVYTYLYMYCQKEVGDFRLYESNKIMGGLHGSIFAVRLIASHIAWSSHIALVNFSRAAKIVCFSHPCKFPITGMRVPTVKIINIYAFPRRRKYLYTFMTLTVSIWLYVQLCKASTVFTSLTLVVSAA